MSKYCLFPYSFDESFHIKLAKPHDENWSTLCKETKSKRYKCNTNKKCNLWALVKKRNSGQKEEEIKRSSNSEDALLLKISLTSMDR